MKTFILASAAAAALFAGPAAAQPRDAGQGASRAQLENRVESLFARVDANRDGFVTEAEANAARAFVRAQRQERRGDQREAAFARLDANGDGSISREEFTARRTRAEGADRGDRREARAERRSDRREARAERRGHRVGARFGARAFERMDANNDNRVSLAEARAFSLQRFDRVDANRDGRIDREERSQRREQRQGRRAG